MEAAPPSYANATLIDVWDIVSRYLPSNDLCSAALVSTRWHTTFTPQLWGNPASHFGIENDAVYVALIRFKRTLQTARLWVRELTHTLHLPPAHAEIYNGPNADWLRDILEHLPNLQSLIVRGLPFFDHGALQALKVMRKKPSVDYGPPSGAIELPGSVANYYQAPATRLSFRLRLLDASRCSNVTSDGLASAICRFEGLMYLDLSFTYPARAPVVLDALRDLSGLQVLKLRGISLRDEEARILSDAISLRVRSLDIRNNRLTDRGVRVLLDKCFKVSSPLQEDAEVVPSGQRSPALLPYLGSEMLDIYQGEQFEGFLRNAFTGRFVSRLAIEDAPSSGITHLYIADNMLTVEGVSGLIRSGRLHVLDVGTVADSLAVHSSLTKEDSDMTMSMPGLEKLTPILSKHAAESMTFLRIDHSVITKEAPRSHLDEVVPGRTELDGTSLPDLPRGAVELDSRSSQPEIFEMSADQQTPRHELAGDPMHFIVSPAINEAPSLSEADRNHSDCRRSGAFAPEVVEALTHDLASTSLLSPVSMLSDAMNSSNSFSAVSPNSSGSSGTPIAGSRPRSYSSMAIERKARLNAHILNGHSLHPAMLPHVKTLVITEVPPTSANLDVANRIIRFIKDCSQEAVLAHNLAKLDYSLPPGRRGHASAIRESANKIFALQRIVLELAPEQAIRRNSKASKWQHTETKSMTEDRDTEALWTAADTDFSFFGDEECGLPTIEAGRFAFDSGKEVNVGQYESRSTLQSSRLFTQPRVSIVTQLSTFRKERNLAHERNLAAGNPEAETEGFWPGLVQVVHPSNGTRSDEETDYYGNSFTNNYLYR